MLSAMHARRPGHAASVHHSTLISQGCVNGAKIGVLGRCEDASPTDRVTEITWATANRRPRTNGWSRHDWRPVLSEETTAQKVDSSSTRGAIASLRSERCQLPAHVTKGCRSGTIGRQFEYPLARRTNELAGDSD